MPRSTVRSMLLLVTCATLASCGGRTLPSEVDGGPPIDGASPRTDLFVIDAPDPGYCTTNAHCPATEYCRLDACKYGNTCLLRPTACDLLYAPVCGCDGQTYGNECAAAMEGASVAYKGECNTGELCLENDNCPADAFCLFGPDCGALLEPGACTLRPRGCDDLWAPVCGCDGKTYGNECEAHSQGVSMQHEGECDGIDGCFFNYECRSGQFCNLDKHCGEASAFIGYCEWLPSGCSKQYAPVCGCDGKTYSNDCMAHQVGVSVRQDGPCEPDLANCELVREEYAKTIALAKSCAPMAPVRQCTMLLEDMLPCGCMTYVNEGNATALKELEVLAVKWDALGCNTIPWPCPGCAPPSYGFCDAATGGCVDQN